MITEKEAVLLFEDYLKNGISDEDAARLLTFLEENDGFSRDTYESLYLDYLLKRRRFKTDKCNACDFDVDESVRFSDPFSGQSQDLPPESPSPLPVRHVPVHFPASSTSRSRKMSKRSLAKYLGLAAVLLFLCWGLFGVYLEFAKTRTNGVVAHVTALDEVVWEGSPEKIDVGAPIPSGLIRLRSGRFALKMLNGVDIVLEGPSELDLRSQERVRLNNGFLSAAVSPQDREIRMETPHMTVNVIGTSFWIKTSGEASEVHLLEGKLKIDSPNMTSRYMDAGEAFSINGTGDSRLFRAMPDQFISHEKLLSKTEEKFQRYEAELRKLTERDPSWLVLLDFQRVGRVTPNYAVHGRDILPEVKIEGCTWMPGEMPGEGAVAFHDLRDRLSLAFPQKLSSLTLACRIKIDAEIQHRIALLMSDELSEGAVQWMIAKKGIPVLNIALGDGGGVQNYTAPGQFVSQRIGYWTHIAVTLDEERSEANWYVDGESIATIRIRNAIPIDIRNALIGNWNRNYDRENAKEKFGLSEFLLFDRALSHEEIRGLSKKHFHEHLTTGEK